MHDYAAFTNEELLAAYADYRRRVALASVSAKHLRREIDVHEAELASRITGKNAEERKVNLALACAHDADYVSMLSRAEALERHQAEAKAECDILSKRLALRIDVPWRRFVEALERLSHDRDAELSTPLVDDALDGMSHGNPESEWYANKPRPRPTYDRDDDIPF